MSGNVWEWCRTKWRENYKSEPDDDLEGDDARVLRGGAFFDVAGDVRCASRFRDSRTTAACTAVFESLRLPSFMTLETDTLDSGTLEIWTLAPWRPLAHDGG